MDGQLIPGSPEDVYDSKFPSKVDFMLGCNSHEGAMFTIGPMRLGKFTNLSEAEHLVKKFLRESFWDSFGNEPGVAEEVIKEYLLSRDVDNFEELQKGMVELLGDVWFAVPTAGMADSHSGELHFVSWYHFCLMI